MQTVVFILGAEEYGIDIFKVQEIIRLPRITKLPNTADYILGVTNLRGNIIPVVDLKKKLMNSLTENTEETRVIVIETGIKKIGLIVDEISEVIMISSESITEAGTIGSNIKSGYLLGVAKMENHLLILLNIDEILNSL